MQIKNTIAALALAGSALAQGRGNMSICDYYTGVLLKNNTAANQLTVLTLLVNTVVIGSYSNASMPSVKVPGILANGTVNNTNVHLLPYFDGGLASTNRGGKAVAVNFLDGGGAAPLKMNMPAMDSTSNQYFLLTHLYQFFGTLLGCSQQGMGPFEAYGGQKSMFDVHRFMNLDVYQNTYFIQQVGMAAASFGVAMDDITTVAQTLGKVFNYKCSPNITITPALGSQQQSICIAESCPTDPNGTCNAYPMAMEPAVANISLAEGLGNMSASVTASAPNGGKPTAVASGSAGGASASATSSAAAAHIMGGGLAAGLGLFAFLL